MTHEAIEINVKSGKLCNIHFDLACHTMYVLPLESIESASTTQGLRGKTQELGDYMSKLAGPNKAKFSSSHQKWKGFT